MTLPQEKTVSHSATPLQSVPGSPLPRSHETTGARLSIERSVSAARPLWVASPPNMAQSPLAGGSASNSTNNSTVAGRVIAGESAGC